MSEIAPRLLNDTLNLVMLAREAALAEGRQSQARRLSPVVDGLRSLASGATPGQPAAATQPASQVAGAGAVGAVTLGPLANPEFSSLLAAAQSAPLGGSSASSAVDRGLVASAMSAGGMPEVDIARQLGVSREEVRLMLATNAIGR
jgi:hypothetical protein